MPLALVLLALAAPQDPPETPPWLAPPEGPREAFEARRRDLSMQRIQQVARRVERELLRARPWLARQLGRDDHDSRTPAVGSAAVAELVDAIEEAEEDLQLVAEGLLPPAPREDLAALRRWLRAERLLASGHDPSVRDPACFVEPLARGIEALALSDDAEVSWRLAGLDRRLQHVPHALELARIDVAFDVRPFLEGARDEADELLRLLEVDLPAAVSGAPFTDAGAAQFGGHRERAIEAARSFRAWAESRLRAAAHPSPAVPGVWLGAAHALAGTGTAPDALRIELFRSISEIATSLEELRAARAPSDEPLDEGEVAARVREACDAAVRRLRAAGLAVDDPPPIEVRVRPAAARTVGLARLVPRGDEPALLRLEVPGDEWPEESRAARRSTLRPAAQRALGVRHGPPGEALLLQRAREAESPVRSTLGNRCTREAWGLYALDWSLRLGGADTDRASPRAIAHREILRLEAVRLLGAMSFHHERRSWIELVDFLALHTGFDALAVAYEAAEIARDPQRGIGYLGYRELARAEASLARDLGEDEAVARILAALLENPARRPGDVEAIVRSALDAEVAANEPGTSEPDPSEPEGGDAGGS